MPGMSKKNSTVVEAKMGSGFADVENFQAHGEYHTLTNPDAIIRKSNAVYKRGMSEHSGGSRGGAVAPPSLNNFKLKMVDQDVR